MFLQERTHGRNKRSDNWLLTLDDYKLRTGITEAILKDDDKRVNIFKYLGSKNPPVFHCTHEVAGRSRFVVSIWCVHVHVDTSADGWMFYTQNYHVW